MLTERRPDNRSVVVVICSTLTIVGVYLLIYSFLWKSWITKLDGSPERNHGESVSDSVSFPDN